MTYLNLEEILILHTYQLDQFSGQDGIRSLPLFESAIIRPQIAFGGNDMYKSIFDKAAALMISIIQNHPFVDGNKRTGIHSGITFMEMNGYELTLSNNELVKLGQDIPNKKYDIAELSGVLKVNSLS